MFKKLFVLMAAGSLLVGGTAQAVPVFTTATLSLSISGLAPITIPGGGTISIVGSTTFVPVGLIALGATLIIPVTATTAIAQLKVTSLLNGAGTFRAGGAFSQAAPPETCPTGAAMACVTGGGVGGTMSLIGTINVSVIPNVLVIQVPLGAALIGLGGSTNVPFTFDGAPWTTGVGQVNTGANTATLTGTNSNLSGGPMTLVTPTFVLAIGNLLPIFTTLTLGQGAHAPVPEPGSLLLIGAGVAGLALLGRRRK